MKIFEEPSVVHGFNKCGSNGTLVGNCFWGPPRSYGNSSGFLGGKLLSFRDPLCFVTAFFKCHSQVSQGTVCEVFSFCRLQDSP